MTEEISLRERSIEIAKEFIQDKLAKGFSLAELTKASYSHIDAQNIVFVGGMNSKGKPYPKDRIRITKIDGQLCTWVWKIEDIYNMLVQPTIL